ncbi:MAG: tRNA pseudouridine(38-40) synthase TruA, partial [Oscillospiraceae bacterium]
MMRTLLVMLRFDGRSFSGWQVQQNAPTVMQTFQEALETVLHEHTDVKGCSRTDAGVHALRYGVSFTTSCAIPVERVPIALNAHLPRQISAIACRAVPDGFHARYDAQGKRYCYRILNTSLRDPFWEGLALQMARPLDEALLNAQAQDFVGTHDFSAFHNAGAPVHDTVRTIFAAGARRVGDQVEVFVE